MAGGRPVVKLVGNDSNAFSVIARVSRALKDAGMREMADEFRKNALKSKSYDEMLGVCMDYVEVR
jgi:hypothetical protein